MLPKTLHRYFWDVKVAALDPKEHKRYIIERLLELGDEDAVRWLFRQFSRDEIKDVLSRSRQISAKSRTCWELILFGHEFLPRKKSVGYAAWDRRAGAEDACPA